jgi:hypothetical protein
VITETEIRDILKIVRQLERVLEQALRSEVEKNEDRVRKQLEASGISIDSDSTELTELESTDAFEL